VGPLGRIGPLAAWELRRLARRGLALRARLLFLYALLVALVGFAAVWFFPVPAADLLTISIRVTPAESAAFADALALVLLEAQLVAVVALTPALAAAAVSEEKDRHTLPLLLTTLLSDREIVFGKAVGRVAFVLAAVLAGVPVLALALLFGGISVQFLLAGYALTAGTTLLCAAVGLGAACGARDLRAAVLRAYARTAVLVCGAFVPPLVFGTPFALLTFVHRDPGAPWALVAGFGYPLAQVLVGLVLLERAARGLRLRGPTAGPRPATAFPAPPRQAEPPLLQADDEVPPDLPPVDSANPVLWKERCVGRTAWAVPALVRAVALGAGALAVVLFGAGVWVAVKRASVALDPDRAGELARRERGTEAGWLLIAAGTFAAGRYLLPLAGGVSGCIAGERFRRTLDPLLGTALDRRTILRAKVQAHAERGTAFGAVGVAAVGMAFTAAGELRLGAAAAVLMVATGALVAACAAWLSVRCPSDARAFRLALPVAMMAVGWPVGAWNLLLLREDRVSPEALARGLWIVTALALPAALALWALAARALDRGE
jgi:hypothetical protein